MNAAIKRLRAALSDSAEAPHYIETLSRRGYRIVAPVDIVPAAGAAAPLDQSKRQIGEDRPRRPRLPLWLAIAGVLLVVGLARWSWLEWRHRNLPPDLVPRIRSLAVLPLENLTGDASQEYFADGMTDALITDLAQIGALRVISRTSVMRFKGTRKALPDIAGELGVDAIVEGTVVRSGNRVRITSQLIYAKSDQHLWAQNYERDLTDVVTLQGEVAQAIADKVRAALTPELRLRMASPHPVNREAYDLYLQGRHHWNQQTAAGIKRSIEYFQRALEIDPNFALAYAGLAEAHNASSATGAFPPKQSFPKAQAAAATAIRLDPLLAEAHTALGVEKARYEFEIS